MKKAERTRQLIIEKAAELFNQKGFAGTSMSDIMQATGLTKGGIYGNFKREGGDKKGVKEEIAIVAFEHAVKKVIQQVSERTHVIENTLDKLKAVVYFYKERILNPPVEGGCPIQNTAIQTDDTNPVLQKKVTQVMDHWLERIVYTLEKGIKKGEVKPDINTEEFAMLFIGTLEGGILLARIYKADYPFEIMSRHLIQMIDELRP